MVFGIGVALLLWTSPPRRLAALRWISVAAMPAVLLALYFTYSRGGLLALAVASVTLLALSRDRLWLLGDAGASGRSGRCRRCSPSRVAAASPTISPTRRPSTRASPCCSSCSPASASPCCSSRRCGGPRAAAGRLTGRAVGALPRSARCSAASPRRRRSLGGRRRDRRRRPRLGPVLQLRHPVPEPPEQHFSDSQRRRPRTTSAGSRSTPSAKSRCSAAAPAPMSSPGSGTARSTCRCTTPTRSTCEAFAELGVVGGLLVLALVGDLLWTGFAAWRAAPAAQRERYAALFAAMLAFAVGAGDRLVLGDRRVRRRLLPRRRRAGRRPLRAARAAADRRRRRAARSGASASRSPAWPSPGSPPWP